MTTENPFKGREFENLVFLSTRARCIYIGLYARQREQWRQDHPDLWKTREDALRDMHPHKGIGTEAELAQPGSSTSENDVRASDKPDGPLPVPSEDERMPHKPGRMTAPLAITGPEATIAAADEIIIGEQRLISERRLAELLGRSPRQLQRWRKEQKGPPCMKIGRRWYYEISKLQEWIERKKAGDVGGSDIGRRR